MSRVCVLMNFEHSAYHSVFRLAEGVRERGHDVELLVPAAFRELVQRRGLALRPLRSPPFSSGGTLVDRVAELAEQLGTLLDEERPDLVLLDQLLWPLAAPLLEREIGLVPLATNLAGSFTFRAPPAFHSFVPTRHAPWLGNALLWGAHLIVGRSASNHATALQLARALAGARSTQYAQAQVHWGRRLVRVRGRLAWGEYGLRLAGTELVLCPSELDFPGVEEGGRRVYAGTCVSHRLPAERDKERLVYCSLGSHQEVAEHRERLLEALVEAARRRPDLDFVLQVPERELVERLGPLPRNLARVEWVDQLELLERASLFVTHAGLASVKEAIGCGVPMLAFPFFNDGFGNAARIRFHHLGLEGAMARVTADSLGALLDRVLSDATYRNATRELAATFRRQEDCAVGVAFVQAVLQRLRH